MKILPELIHSGNSWDNKSSEVERIIMHVIETYERVAVAVLNYSFESWTMNVSDRSLRMNGSC
jgi:hypothetical protein